MQTRPAAFKACLSPTWTTQVLRVIPRLKLLELPLDPHPLGVCRSKDDRKIHKEQQPRKVETLSFLRELKDREYPPLKERLCRKKKIVLEIAFVKSLSWVNLYPQVIIPHVLPQILWVAITKSGTGRSIERLKEKDWFSYYCPKSKLFAFQPHPCLLLFMVTHSTHLLTAALPLLSPFPVSEHLDTCHHWAVFSLKW